MPLVTNDLKSLFGGVNQQSAEHRNNNQVEEMINAVPTIDRGLLKRNPTARIDLSDTIAYTNEVWNYEYDRGSVGGNEEKYTISITNENGMEIINVNSGKVYTEANGGISMSQAASDYMYPFVGANGYAATTVKDSTFLVNKSVLPRLTPSVYDPEDTTSTQTVYTSTIPFVTTPDPIKVVGSSGSGDLASYYLDSVGTLPAKLMRNSFVDNHGLRCGNAVLCSQGWSEQAPTTLSITVDGFTVSYTDYGHNYDSGLQAYPHLVPPPPAITTMSNFMAAVYSNLQTSLNSVYGGLYSVDLTSDKLKIKKTDGSLMVVSYSLSMSNLETAIGVVGSPIKYHTLPVVGDFFGTIVDSSQLDVIQIPNNSYLSTGFVWVSRAASTASYNYIATVKVAGSAAVKISAVTGTSTDIVATNIATALSLETNITAVAVGSIVKITTDDESEIEYVSSSDSYGNQASRGFAYTVATMNDLPSNMEFEGTTIKVSGTENGVFQTYWVKYDGSVWKETKDPEALSSVDANTMPHILIRNADDTFTLEEYPEWSSRAVGDDETNEYPSFVSNGKVSPSPIKDIFFFKNRLGFITHTTVAMSEVGSYGNFWRTTVFAVLDSDPIDTSVDSNQAIELEYASYLEDSLMLFADKAQFRLSGANILSPKSVQISQTSAFETNKNVRPIFLNDKIFFVVKRGENSALYEYFISNTSSDKSEAVDVTAHVQTYLPNDISKLSGSPVNNMLFAFSRATPDTIYVYKYYDVGNERAQSSWFKWTFNGTLYNMFSFGKNLNIMINRKQSIAIEDWVVGSGIWDGSKKWNNSLLWVMSPDSLTETSQFEQMKITPQHHNGVFIDDDREIEDLDSVVSMTLDATVVSGDVLSRKDIRILLVEDSVNVVFTHAITAGTVTFKVTHGTSESTATATVGDIQTTINIPRSAIDSITRLDIIPDYVNPTNITMENVSIKYNFSDEELLYIDGVTGWYVDDVAIPTDPALNQGNWVKNFGTKTAGSIIPTKISLGEWVLSTGGEKNIRGHLHFKTAQISSEEGSDFSLVVQDIARGTEREVKSKYTVGRKPMVYGDAIDIRLHIVSNSEIGFRINTVSYEGNFNSRNKKV